MVTNISNQNNIDIFLLSRHVIAQDSFFHWFWQNKWICPFEMVNTKTINLNKGICVVIIFPFEMLQNIDSTFRSAFEFWQFSSGVDQIKISEKNICT